MSTHNVFKEQRGDRFRFLVQNSESFGPLCQVVHEDSYVTVTIRRERKFQYINSNSVEQTTNRDRLKRRF
jgi:hypothetical protein